MKNVRAAKKTLKVLCKLCLRNHWIDLNETLGTTSPTIKYKGTIKVCGILLNFKYGCRVIKNKMTDNTTLKVHC